MDFSIKAIFYCIFRNSGLPDKLSCFLFGFVDYFSYIVGWLGGSREHRPSDSVNKCKKSEIFLGYVDYISYISTVID